MINDTNHKIDAPINSEQQSMAPNFTREQYGFDPDIQSKSQQVANTIRIFYLNNYFGLIL